MGIWRKAGPILVGFNRAGLNGRTFRLYRFNESGRFGPIFSKTGLSSLPQVLSVMLGDMNIVGPRAVNAALSKMSSAAIPNYAERMKVKPGLIGLATVIIAGKRLDLDAELAADLHYVKNRSLLLDCWILSRAIWRALRFEL